MQPLHVASIVSSTSGTSLPETSSETDRSLARRIDVSVSKLAGWLETIRGTDGYGGPVSHWWQNCFMYTGVGLDWRYEGIVTGYLTLLERTRQPVWKERAIRAGRDLVAGQREDSSFNYSGFELNPKSAGTPHEAACDIALLRLATVLKQDNDDTWNLFAATAERNIRQFHIDRLWDSDFQRIADGTHGSPFVPNKAASACEALFLLAELLGDSELVECYALPTLDHILGLQVQDRSPLRGAISQNSFGNRVVEKYFPIYISRCVPAMLAGYAWSGQERYVEAAKHAVRFIDRWTAPDGSLPAVIYADGRTSAGPTWIAPLGDVLRAMDLVNTCEHVAESSMLLQRLLAGQDESGGIQTATGFAKQTGNRSTSTPDIRDILHVAGWNDKAFRYLTQHVSGCPISESNPESFERTASLLGSEYRFAETTERVEVTRNGSTHYLWIKGEPHPRVASPEFWLR